MSAEDQSGTSYLDPGRYQSLPADLRKAVALALDVLTAEDEHALPGWWAELSVVIAEYAKQKPDLFRAQLGLPKDFAPNLSRENRAELLLRHIPRDFPPYADCAGRIGRNKLAAIITIWQATSVQIGGTPRSRETDLLLIAQLLAEREGRSIEAAVMTTARMALKELAPIVRKEQASKAGRAPRPGRVTDLERYIRAICQVCDMRTLDQVLSVMRGGCQKCSGWRDGDICHRLVNAINKRGGHIPTFTVQEVTGSKIFYRNDVTGEEGERAPGTIKNIISKCTSPKRAASRRGK